ncbi:MAG: DUF2157 domain-containing protein [Dehalococcoidia bacterium]|nr:DUF2157 domain-containing protein [Dehalococcoidia bacterium]
MQGNLISTLAVLGAVLFGLGVLLFIGANWQELNRWGKLTLLFAGMLGTYGAGWWLRFVRDYHRLGTAVIFLGAVVYGASVFLIAQIYRVRAGEPSLLLYWFLGVAPLAYIKESPVRTGREVVLQASPIDPRDPFRGDYVVLRYTITNLAETPGGYTTVFYDQFSVGDTVYVHLELDGARLVLVGAVARSPQPDWDLYIRGRVTESTFPDPGVRQPIAPLTAPSISVEYGIESYFVPEGVGLELQRSRDIKAVVVIDFEGHAVLKSLIVDGKPFQTR